MADQNVISIEDAIKRAPNLSLEKIAGAPVTSPKVFISYSWTTEEHQRRVKSWAERLFSDGIEVTLDIFDLREGNDKFAFMERMISDPSITHVLIFSDRQYSEKADARVAGVGTESQIISKDIYEKIDQIKFIPIVCEFSNDGAAFLPVFLRSRIWIDFSSQEAVNKNWEQLIRLLFGKPQYERPQLGAPPRYITESNNLPFDSAGAKLSNLRRAVLEGKPALNIYRKDFINASLAYADTLRMRSAPSIDLLGQRILDDCGKLRIVRDYLTDWVLLESGVTSSTDFTESVLDLLERLIEIKSRPAEVTAWSENWFDAHGLFVYETFLYIVAALIKNSAFSILYEIYSSHYLKPRTERHGDNQFDKFDKFYGYSDAIHIALSGGKNQYHSAGAELIKRQADRSDLPFQCLIEAELLTYLMTLITPNTRWYPGTLHYSAYSQDFPLFLRAAQHKHFAKLATITGVSDGTALRNAVKAAIEAQGSRLSRFDRGFWSAMNMDRLDSIK